jgi:hypothetical protein
MRPASAPAVRRSGPNVLAPRQEEPQRRTKAPIRVRCGPCRRRKTRPATRRSGPQCQPLLLASGLRPSLFVHACPRSGARVRPILRHAFCTTPSQARSPSLSAPRSDNRGHPSGDHHRPHPPTPPSRGPDPPHPTDADRRTRLPRRRDPVLGRQQSTRASGLPPRRQGLTWCLANPEQSAAEGHALDDVQKLFIKLA